MGAHVKTSICVHITWHYEESDTLVEVLITAVGIYLRKAMAIDCFYVVFREEWPEGDKVNFMILSCICAECKLQLV